MIERIYTLFLIIIIIKSEVWTIIHCLRLGHETMVRAVYLFIFLRYNMYGYIYGVLRTQHEPEDLIEMETVKIGLPILFVSSSAFMHWFNPENPTRGIYKWRWVSWKIICDVFFNLAQNHHWRKMSYLGHILRSVRYENILLYTFLSKASGSKSGVLQPYWSLAVTWRQLNV